MGDRLSPVLPARPPRTPPPRRRPTPSRPWCSVRAGQQPSLSGCWGRGRVKGADPRMSPGPAWGPERWGDTVPPRRGSGGETLCHPAEGRGEKHAVCQCPPPLLPSHCPREPAVGQAPAAGGSCPRARLGQHPRHGGRPPLRTHPKPGKSEQALAGPAVLWPHGPVPASTVAYFLPGAWKCGSAFTHRARGPGKQKEAQEPAGAWWALPQPSGAPALATTCVPQSRQGGPCAPAFALQGVCTLSCPGPPDSPRSSRGPTPEGLWA